MAAPRASPKLAQIGAFGSLQSFGIQLQLHYASSTGRRPEHNGIFFFRCITLERVVLRRRSKTRHSPLFLPSDTLFHFLSHIAVEPVYIIPTIVAGHPDRGPSHCTPVPMCLWPTHDVRNQSRSTLHRHRGSTLGRQAIDVCWPTLGYLIVPTLPLMPSGSVERRMRPSGTRPAGTPWHARSLTSSGEYYRRSPCSGRSSNSSRR